MKSKLSLLIIVIFLIQNIQIVSASIQSPVLNDDFEFYSVGENIAGEDGWALSGDVKHFIASQREAGNIEAEFSTVGKTGDGYVYKNFATSSTVLTGDCEVSFDYKISDSYSKGMQFNIQPLSGHGVCIEFGINNISYNNGSGVVSLFSNLGKNIWRTVTVKVHTISNTFDIIISDTNGIQSATALSPRGSLTAGIGRLLIASKKGDAVVWLDNLKAGLSESGGGVVPPPEPVENDEVIVFIGDSITAAGGYPNYIQDFYATRYPDKRITYYNSACGGHTAGDVLLRYDYDVAPYTDATQVFILLGTNDIKPFLYIPENEGNASKDAEKAAYLASAENNMNQLLSKIRTDFPDVSVTLMLDPAIDVQSDWASVGVSDAGVFSDDVNDALRTLGEKYKQLCATYNASYIDMNLYMFKAVQKQIELGISSDYWVVKKDRIHPNNIGQMVMTYHLLKELYATDSVSSVAINAENMTIAEAVNCTADNLQSIPDDGFSFKYTPMSLPMYATNDYIYADNLVPWSDELNREILKIENLPVGNYEIALDSSAPIKATNAELAGGINISTLAQNPNQRISLNIYNASKAKRAKEVILRDIMRAKTQLIKDGIDLTDADAVVSQLNSYGTESSLGKNAQTALSYITDFSDPLTSIRRIQGEIKAMEAELYSLCVPNSYVINVRKADGNKELGLLYKEDFESMTDSNITWEAYTHTTNLDRANLTEATDGQMSIVTDANEKYGKALEIIDGSATKIVRADGPVYVNGCSNLRIELDIKPQPYSVLQFTDDSSGTYSTDSNSYFFHLAFLDGGKLQYRDTGLPVDTEGNLYNAGEWNHVTVYLDTKTPAYSIYVNGALITERSTLKWGVGRTLDTIVVGSMFSVSRAMTTSIDNIKIYNEDCKVIVNERGFYSESIFVDVPVAGNKVKAAAKLVNQTGVEYPVHIFLVQYNKSGKLTEVTQATAILTSDTGIQSIETPEITADVDSTFKILLWNNMLSPLCELLKVSNFETWEDISQNIKLLYSSDTTNILTCVSPWRASENNTLTETLITAPLDEVVDKGIDVYNLQPGLGWVPWWYSSVYPVGVHTAWFQENVRSNASNVFLNYTLAGNDLITQSLNKSKDYGKAMMASFRLNDVHQKDVAYDPLKARIESVPRIYWEHPEYLVGADQNQASYGQYVQDWRFEEVRNYKFSLIKEIIENYDIDGIELDFMRSTVLFNTNKTTHAERDEIMLDFIKKVRKELDKKEGRYRYLSVRIPAHIYCHDAIGVDVQSFAKAGVNIFDLSTYFCTEQETSLGLIKELVGENCLVFAELTYATAIESVNGQTKTRRATPEQLNTAAYLAYKHGADGISLFNFQYYREQANIEDGPYSEPPFDLIQGFKNKEYLSTQPQHYFYGVNHHDPKKPEWPLPKQLAAGLSVSWNMNMAAPLGGWSEDGVLRIQGKSSLTGRAFSAKVNNIPLQASAEVSEPYDNPYTQLLGTVDELRAWIVPRSVLNEGYNTIEIKMETGETAILDYIDLAIK